MNKLSLKYKMLLTILFIGSIFLVLLEFIITSNHNDWEIILGIGLVFGYIVSLFLYKEDLKVPKFMNRALSKVIIVLSILAFLIALLYGLLSYLILQSHIPGFIMAWFIISLTALLSLMMLSKIFMKDAKALED